MKEPFLKLKGNICPHCEEKMFPPRAVCLNCGQATNSEPKPQESEELVTELQPEIIQ